MAEDLNKINELQSQIDSLKRGYVGAGAASAGNKLVVNYDMARVHAFLDASKNDHLVINEIVNGKELTLLEVFRKAGPLAADNNVNTLC